MTGHPAGTVVLITATAGGQGRAASPVTGTDPVVDGGWSAILPGPC
ncbi:hypothetical protein [Modestobacter roseus]|uniref:Uncharacterized protein n=1 Tax=Modestobacter roseus TaxID=1181884 RepID=A0A562IQ19_9ACTN|nr:hypothetical protein [Modestobacter roseus]TWH72694.1 hypothetical protein JD78_01216 [Modestobacter roseus]